MGDLLKDSDWDDPRHPWHLPASEHSMKRGKDPLTGENKIPEPTDAIEKTKKMIRSLLLVQKQMLDHMLHSATRLCEEIDDEKTDLNTFSILHGASNISIKAGAEVVMMSSDALDSILGGNSDE